MLEAASQVLSSYHTVKVVAIRSAAKVDRHRSFAPKQPLREMPNMQAKRPEALRFRVFLARREGFEPPAFWSVGCLTRKSEPFRLRFVLFTAVHSADFPLFPPRHACSGSVLGQKWVKVSSQAVFKAGMSFTKVSHTEGMSIEPYHKVREKKKIFLKPRTMWYDL